MANISGEKSQPRVTPDDQRTQAANIQILWAYPLLIAVAEVTTVVISPQAGLIAHGLLLVMLIIHRAITPREAEQQLTLALLLAPLTRVLSLALPLNHISQPYWYGLIALPLLVVAWLTGRRLRLSRRKLGLRPGNLLLQGMVAAGGLGLGAAAYAILRPAPMAGDLALHAPLLSALAIVICGGLVEEIIFRGVLQAAAVRALGRWAMIYGALVFAMLQIGYRSPEYLLLALGAGLLFAYIARLSGSILGVALAHGMANGTLLFLMPALTANPAGPAARLAPWAIGAGTLLALSACGMLLRQALGRRGAPEAVAPGIQPGVLRELRIRSNLTYVQLALRCGISARLLAELEYGLCPLLPEHIDLITAGLRIKQQTALPAAHKR
ncbi:MAG: CPBP family glutamic-type intramembrane protease [Chloroflexales bacterium]